MDVRRRGLMTSPQAPNQHWAPDFVADVLSWGGAPGAIVDDFTGAALALVLDASIDGRQAVSA